jgi:ATP-binding protein involved in chromosome partitioning
VTRQLAPVPVSVVIGPPAQITVAWRDGRSDVHGARALRLACPCAHCVHEITGKPLLDPATVPSDLSAVEGKRVGNYAWQFLWSDGHRTGLYSFALLRALGGSAHGG